MEWLTCIKKSIQYMEDHLTDDISVQDIAKQVHISPFFLQRGFSVITGYGIAEYLRSRRLYLAAMEIIQSNDKIIDIALRYGYETPESFTKAFSRFHHATPTQVRNGEASIKVFLPLTVNIAVHGGMQMDYMITNLSGFAVIGFQKEFTYDESYARIPEYWDSLCEKYADVLYAGKRPETPDEKALVDHRVGTYGVCIDDVGDGRFRYLVAGEFTGGEVPEGMTLYEFPDQMWAVFDCYGPIPEAFQTLNTKIFQDWLPGNPEFELSGHAYVEWYDCMRGKKDDQDYHSAIWIPVERKADVEKGARKQ